MMMKKTVEYNNLVKHNAMFNQYLSQIPQMRITTEPLLPFVFLASLFSSPRQRAEMRLSQFTSVSDRRWAVM